MYAHALLVAPAAARGRSPKLRSPEAMKVPDDGDVPPDFPRLPSPQNMEMDQLDGLQKIAVF